MKAGHVIEIIKDIQGKKSLREFAAELGVSAGHLCDTYNGKVEPGKKILRKIGLEKSVQVTRVVEYSRIGR